MHVIDHRKFVSLAVWGLSLNNVKCKSKYYVRCRFKYYTHWGRMKPGAKKIHHEKKVHHIIIWLIFFHFAENQNHPLGNLRENVISIFYLMENMWKFLSNMRILEVFCHLCSNYIKYPYSIIHFLKRIIKTHLII